MFYLFLHIVKKNMRAIVERIGCNPRELLHNPIIHGTIWQVPDIFGGYYRATHVGMSATRRPIVWDDSREKKGCLCWQVEKHPKSYPLNTVGMLWTEEILWICHLKNNVMG